MPGVVGAGGGGGWRGWVRDRKGGKVTSYDVGGGGAISWHIHTHSQGTVHFSLHSEHTSCVMVTIVSDEF